jgi:hypothetical protein
MIPGTLKSKEAPIAASHVVLSLLAKYYQIIVANAESILSYSFQS